MALEFTLDYLSMCSNWPIWFNQKINAFFQNVSVDPSLTWGGGDLVARLRAQGVSENEYASSEAGKCYIFETGIVQFGEYF